MHFCSDVLSPTGAPTPSYHPACQPHQVLECGQEGRFLGKKIAHCLLLAFCISSDQGFDFGGDRGGEDLPLLSVPFLCQQQQLRTGLRVRREGGVRQHQQPGDEVGLHRPHPRRDFGKSLLYWIERNVWIESCANSSTDSPILCKFGPNILFKVFVLRLLHVDLHVLKWTSDPDCAR